METVVKKKKKTPNKKKSVERQVRVILRPNQSLGATFEYHDVVRALQVSEFVPNSAVQQGGVAVGMFLTEIDDLDVTGLKQSDVIFILQQKASTLREIIFSKLDTSHTPHHRDHERELRSQSASHGRNVLLSPASDNRYSLPHLHTVSSPSSTPKTKASLSSTQHTPESPSSSYMPHNASSVLTQPPYSGFGAGDQVLHSSSTTRSDAFSATTPTFTASSTSSRNYSVAYRANGQRAVYGGVSTALRMGEGRGGEGRGGEGRSSTTTSNPPADPFSTPARRRRLIADISKFLLKQYCVKACENVYLRRHRTQCAITMQCAWRCCRARRLHFRLLFAKKSSAAVTVQTMYRCWVAREDVRNRRKLRHIARTVALAMKLQCRFRCRRARRILLRLREERVVLLHKMNTAAVRLQRNVHMFLAKRRVGRIRKDREVLRIRQERAALRLECMYRQRVANRVVDQLRRSLRTQKEMVFRIITVWRRYRLRRHCACVCIQRVMRGMWGRDLARRHAEAAKRREGELALMRQEDDLSHILRDQDVLEICVDVHRRLLYELKGCSAPDLVKWCVRQSLLCFDCVTGEYGVGVAICRAVEAAALYTNKGRYYHDGVSQGRASMSGNGTGTGRAEDGCDRVEIRGLSGNGVCGGLPEDGQCPALWGQRYTSTCTARSTALTEVAQLEEQVQYMRERNRQLADSFVDTYNGEMYSGMGSTALTVQVNEKGMIVLHIENPVKSQYVGTDRSPQGHHPMDNADIFIMLQAIPTDSADISDEGDGDGQEMLNFKFRDITVSISLTSVADDPDPQEEEVDDPVTPVKEEEVEDNEGEVSKVDVSEPLEDEGIITNDEVDEDEQNESEDEVIILLPRPTTAVASRPSTATARVKVSIIDEEALLRAEREAEEARRRQEEAERKAAELRARQAQLAQLTRRAMTIRIQVSE